MASWRDAVLASLHSYRQRRSTRVIQRQTFIDEELNVIVQATASQGATPAYTLSKTLQELRDEGLLQFLDRGEYLLLDEPIDVDDEDLSDEAIDFAILSNRLLLGIVPTANQHVIARRRQGQSRIRSLTAANYGSRCAVCDVDHSILLIASHIVGWAEEPEHRGNLSNVICLCRMHDALFETGFWSLDDRLNIVRRPHVASRTITMLLDALEGFRPPAAFPPAPEFVERHRRRSGI